MLIGVFICSVLVVGVAATPTLLLNMLIRDEAVHLARTLPLWAPLIDAWAVCLLSPYIVFYFNIMRVQLDFIFYFQLLSSSACSSNLKNESLEIYYI